MFGYVIANSQKLTPEENRIYKEAYCGLCHSLGERHGVGCRITLNYDMAFLTLLLSSVYGIGFDPGIKRCPIHPAKKLPYLTNEITEYAADMNIALTKQSCLDKWADDRNVAGLAASRALASEYRRVASKYPRQCGVIEESLSELSGLQKKGCTEIDKAAGCFGKLLSEVFIWQEDAMTGRLRDFGFALGKVIYIMDAAVDLKSDLRRKRYNPLAFIEGTDTREILCTLMSSCTEAYEKLCLTEHKGIFENILYSGIWTRFDIAKKKGAAAHGK